MTLACTGVQALAAPRAAAAAASALAPRGGERTGAATPARPRAPLDARVRGRDGRQRVQAQLQVERAPAEVVHDADRVAARAQVQRGGPAAVPVPACARAPTRSHRPQASSAGRPAAAPSAAHPPAGVCPTIAPTSVQLPAEAIHQDARPHSPGTAAGRRALAERSVLPGDRLNAACLHEASLQRPPSSAALAGLGNATPAALPCT